MRIVHIIIGLGVGGAELMLKRLILNSSQKNQFEHVVISLTDLGVVGHELQSKGIIVHSLGMKSPLSIPKIFLYIRKLLKKIEPDVVQTWMYHADFLGGLAAKSLGIKKVIWNVRNTHLDSSGKINFIFRKFCALLSYIVPHQIIYVSYSAQKSHLKAGYDSKKGVVIGNGFNVDQYIFDHENRERYRKDLNLKHDEVAVFSVGRCIPAKDHLTFIQSICIAASKNKNIKGVLVGRDLDLEKFKLSSIEKKYFIILGERFDIAALLSAADIFCLHSITEGFPNVLGEAMSVGLPCITTKAGDAELILCNDAYTVEVRDASTIAVLIEELASKDSISRLAIGKENRAKVLDKFTLEVILNKYFSLYKK